MTPLFKIKTRFLFYCLYAVADPRDFQMHAPLEFHFASRSLTFRSEPVDSQ